jgi:hypothetical protein
MEGVFSTTSSVPLCVSRDGARGRSRLSKEVFPRWKAFFRQPPPSPTVLLPKCNTEMLLLSCATLRKCFVAVESAGETQPSVGNGKATAFFLKCVFHARQWRTYSSLDSAPRGGASVTARRGELGIQGDPVAPQLLLSPIIEEGETEEVGGTTLSIFWLGIILPTFSVPVLKVVTR